MTDRDTPAFPFTKILESDVRTGAPVRSELFPGLTMRDYIATHALAGMVPNDHGGFKDWGWYAEAAYSLADAMLSARSKT